MEVILHSDIARLVLGYLRDNNLESACRVFTKSSKYLQEEYWALKSGYRPISLRIGNLEQILREYCSINAKVNVYIESLPEPSKAEFHRQSNLLNKINLLIENSEKDFNTNNINKLQDKSKRKRDNSNDSYSDCDDVSSQVNNLSDYRPKKKKKKRDCGSYCFLNTSPVLNKKPGHSSDSDEYSSDYDLNVEKEKYSYDNQSVSNDSVSNDAVQVPSIPEISDALLSNVDFHNKLAKNINHVLKNINSSSQPENVPTKQKVTQMPEENVFDENYLDSVIKDVLNATQKDQTFDNIIDNVFASNVNNKSVQVVSVDVKEKTSTLPETLLSIPATGGNDETIVQIHPSPSINPTASQSTSVFQSTPEIPLVQQNVNCSEVNPRTPHLSDFCGNSSSLIDPNFSISKLIVLNRNDGLMNSMSTEKDSLFLDIPTSRIDCNSPAISDQVYLDINTGQLTFACTDGLSVPVFINNEIAQQLQDNLNLEQPRVEIPLAERIIVSVDQLPPNAIIFNNDNPYRLVATSEETKYQSTNKLNSVEIPTSLDSRIIAERATPLRGIINSKHVKSLSTPRNKSHVRVLDFSPLPQNSRTAITHDKRTDKENKIVASCETSNKNNNLVTSVEILPVITAFNENKSLSVVPSLESAETTSSNSNECPSNSCDVTVINKLLLEIPTPSDTQKSKQVVCSSNNTEQVEKKIGKDDINEETIKESNSSNPKSNKKDNVKSITKVTPCVEETKKEIEEATLTDLQKWEKMKVSSQNFESAIRQACAEETFKVTSAQKNKKRIRKNHVSKAINKKSKHSTKNKSKKEITEKNSTQNTPKKQLLSIKLPVPQKNNDKKDNPTIEEKSKDISIAINELDKNSITETTPGSLTKPSDSDVKNVSNDDLILKTVYQHGDVDIINAEPSPSPSSSLQQNQPIGIVGSNLNENLPTENVLENLSIIQETPFKNTKPNNLISVSEKPSKTTNDLFKDFKDNTSTLDLTVDRNTEINIMEMTLDTPFKDICPPTPGNCLSKALETPITKFINSLRDSPLQILDSPLLNYVITPGFGIAPLPKETPKSGLLSCPTDYSSGGSYYKPDESNDLDKDIDKQLKDEINQRKRKTSQCKLSFSNKLSSKSQNESETQIDETITETEIETVSMEPTVLERLKSLDDIPQGQPHYKLAKGLPEISENDEIDDGDKNQSSSSSSSSTSSSSTSSSMSTSSKSSSSSSSSFSESTKQSLKSVCVSLSNIDSSEDEEWIKLKVKENEKVVNANTHLVSNDGEVRYPVRSWITPKKEIKPNQNKMKPESELQLMKMESKRFIQKNSMMSVYEQRSKHISDLEQKRLRVKQKLNNDFKNKPNVLKIEGRDHSPPRSGTNSIEVLTALKLSAKKRPSDLPTTSGISKQLTSVSALKPIASIRAQLKSSEIKNKSNLKEDPKAIVTSSVRVSKRLRCKPNYLLPNIFPVAPLSTRRKAPVPTSATISKQDIRPENEKSVNKQETTECNKVECLNEKPKQPKNSNNNDNPTIKDKQIQNSKNNDNPTIKDKQIQNSKNNDNPTIKDKQIQNKKTNDRVIIKDNQVPNTKSKDIQKDKSTSKSPIQKIIIKIPKKQNQKTKTERNKTEIELQKLEANSLEPPPKVQKASGDKIVSSKNKTKKGKSETIKTQPSSSITKPPQKDKNKDSKNHLAKSQTDASPKVIAPMEKNSNTNLLVEDQKISNKSESVNKSSASINEQSANATPGKDSKTDHSSESYDFSYTSCDDNEDDDNNINCQHITAIENERNSTKASASTSNENSKSIIQNNSNSNELGVNILNTNDSKSSKTSNECELFNSEPRPKINSVEDKIQQSVENQQDRPIQTIPKKRKLQINQQSVSNKEEPLLMSPSPQSKPSSTSTPVPKYKLKYSNRHDKTQKFLSTKSLKNINKKKPRRKESEPKVQKVSKIQEKEEKLESEKPNSEQTTEAVNVVNSPKMETTAENLRVEDIDAILSHIHGVQK